MAKSGKYSKISGRHGREGFRQWREDQKNSNRRSVEAGFKWVLVPVTDPEATAPVVADPEAGEDLVTSNQAELSFRSDVSALRPHPAQSWGYRVVRYLTDKDAPTGRKPKKRGAGRPRKRDFVGRSLVAGEPAIDAGASAMERFPDGDTKIPEDQLTEDGDPFVVLLDKAAAILATYDSLDTEIRTRKVNEDPDTRRERQNQNRRRRPGEAKIERATETVEVTKVRERLPESKGSISNLQRRTIDVSPGLSRCVQRMIEAKLLDEARKILDELVVRLCEEFEMVFPGSKVVGGGWHVRSGQLHLDLWTHGTWLEEVAVGIKRDPQTVRLWDADILCHFGPGPGVCAWDRHVAALGDEAGSYCPGIVKEVSKALAEKEQRAAGRDPKRRGAGQANRDVEIHRRFDRIVLEALPPEFVEIGMNEYREHLKAVYRNANDPKMTPELRAAAEQSIAARLEAAERDRQDAAADREKAEKERLAATAAREKAVNDATAAGSARTNAEDAARRQAAPILREAAEVRAKVAVLEREVARREVVVKTALSVARQGLAGKVRALRTKLQAASSRRKLVVEKREADLLDSRVGLAGRIRALRNRIRDGISGKISQAMDGVAVLVLGKQLAAKLLATGIDPKYAVRDEIARLRLVERTLGVAIKEIKTVPGSDAEKILTRAKGLMITNAVARKAAPVPAAKKNDKEQSV